MAAVDANTLLDDTKCYACFGMSVADLLKLGLLGRIYSSGAAGGNLYGFGSPEGVITANTGAGYFDLTNGLEGFWMKKSGSGNTGWHQLI